MGKARKFGKSQAVTFNRELSKLFGWQRQNLQGKAGEQFNAPLPLGNAGTVGGDNLGDHIARRQLQMKFHEIANCSLIDIDHETDAAAGASLAADSATSSLAVTLPSGGKVLFQEVLTQILEIEEGVGLKLLGSTHNIDFNDNEANNVAGIDFQAGGPTTTDTLPVIWADASGDMIFNVATGDAFFWSENGTGTQLASLLDGEFEVRTANEDGPTLRLRNNDQTPNDNDLAAQILFTGEDSAGNETTYGDIRVEMEDVTNGTEDSSLNIRLLRDGAVESALTLNAETEEFVINGGWIVRSNASAEIGFQVTNTSITLGTEGTIQIPHETGSAGSAAAADTDFGDANACMGIYLSSGGNPVLCFREADGDWATQILTGAGLT